MFRASAQHALKGVGVRVNQTGQQGPIGKAIDFRTDVAGRYEPGDVSRFFTSDSQTALETALGVSQICKP